jgi:hypothetical protein
VYCGNYLYILWFSIGFKCTAGIISITLKAYREPENIEIIPTVHLKPIENQRI